MVNILWGFFIGVGLSGNLFKYKFYNLIFKKIKNLLLKIFEQEVSNSIWYELFIQN